MKNNNKEPTKFILTEETSVSPPHTSRVWQPSKASRLQKIGLTATVPVDRGVRKWDKGWNYPLWTIFLFFNSVLHSAGMAIMRRHSKAWKECWCCILFAFVKKRNVWFSEKKCSMEMIWAWNKSLWLLLRVEDTGYVTIERRLTNLLLLLFSLFFCPFVSYCFTSTASSTPSKSLQSSLFLSCREGWVSFF